MDKDELNYEEILSELNKAIPIEEIRRDYIFLRSNKILVGTCRGIEIYTDIELPPNTIYLMRKEDYK